MSQSRQNQQSASGSSSQNRQGLNVTTSGGITIDGSNIQTVINDERQLRIDNRTINIVTNNVTNNVTNIVTSQHVTNNVISHPDIQTEAEAEELSEEIISTAENSIYEKYLPNWDDIKSHQREFTEMICAAVKGRQMRVVKAAISKETSLEFELRMSSIDQFGHINNFLAKVDPHLHQLSLHPPSNETFNSNDFDRWLQVVGNLTNKVRYVLIDDATSTILNNGKMEQFLNNVEGRLEISYHENESSQQVGNSERQMQDFCNRLQSTEMYIDTQHNYHVNHIKQQHDPSMTSSNQVASLITDSPFGGNRKSLKWIPSSDEMLNNLSRHINGKGWDFDLIIADMNDVKHLGHVLRRTNIKIANLFFYIPRDSSRDDVKLLCDVITGNDGKIGIIDIFNLNKSNYRMNLVKLASKVETNLTLRFTDDRSSEDKDDLEELYQSLQSKAQIELHFTGDIRIINKN